MKIIGPEALYEDDTKDLEWLRKQHTHKGQLLALVHDMDEHPREEPSLEALESVAFLAEDGSRHDKLRINKPQYLTFLSKV